VGILITSSAEVPGLLFSLVIVAYFGRKVAFAVPMAAIAVVLVPLMAGELWWYTAASSTLLAT
jgi:hypothetical protein